MIERNIQLILIKSELGAGTYGANLGIEAIKFAAMKADSDLFREYDIIHLDCPDEYLYAPERSPHARSIELILKLYQKIADRIEDSLMCGNFPFIISGDHSNAGGTIAGIRKAYPDKRLGVIWIDAHADIHSPYTTPSGNLHGMPLAASLNLQTENPLLNQPDLSTKRSWARLCNVGDVAPKIEATDLVLVDIRDCEAPEWELIKRLNIKYFEPSDLNSLGAKEVANQTLQYLAGCDFIYVSFDIDSMDAELVPGTGTPVTNGMNFEQTDTLLQAFWASEKLISMEFTEINPLLDVKNQTAEIAFRLISNLVK